jgi:DNA-binding NarL/FixJ family response regulator
MNILIVDQNNEARINLQRLLEDSDNAILTAENKEKALGLLAWGYPIELVIVVFATPQGHNELELIERASAFPKQFRFWITYDRATNDALTGATKLNVERAMLKSKLTEELMQAGIVKPAQVL